MDPTAFRDSPAGRAVRAKGGFWAFVPNPLPPSLQWNDALVASLAAAERVVGELAGLGRSLPNPHLLIRPFIRREAVLSSRIEGTRASLSDLYVYEAVREQQLPLFEFPSDVHEVHNYVHALEYGLERLQTLPVSLRLMREIHARLLEGVRGMHQAPGEFRRTPNWVGPPGSTPETAPYVPPPVDEMHQALDALEKFFHTSSSLPALVRLGLIHYQFEAIHPFLDGNGRVGRLLIVLLLVAWKLLPSPLLYLSAYFEQHRQRYYDSLLAVSQRGTWERWLAFFLDGVTAQARDATWRIRRLQTLQARYRGLFQTQRSAARLLQLVDLLFAHPILTVNEVARALSVNYVTASRYVRQLEGEGLLREITGRGRDRVYRADNVLHAIEAPLSLADEEAQP